MIKPQLTIGWKVSTLNPAIASLRYRAMLPILALEHFEIHSKIFVRSSRHCLADLDALVIVKSFTLEDYWLAQEAFSLKIPVIFDLCDNIFIDQYVSKKHISPAEVFLLIASVASAIVVTTEPLAAVVREKIGDRISIHVVPDGIETTALLSATYKQLRLPQLKEYCYRLSTNNRIIRLIRLISEKYRLLRSASHINVLRRLLNDSFRQSFNLISSTVDVIKHSKYLNWRFWAKPMYSGYDHLRAQLTGTSPKLNSQVKHLAPIQPAPQNAPTLLASPTSRKVLWFGNHGANHAKFGMLDLLYIREALEKLATEFDLELIVISNNIAKFNQYIRPIAIPSRYVEWSTDATVEYLRSADVVVIPNSLDEFSICKSANRTVLSLMQGVPVVATTTPGLEMLRGCIGLDDFEGNLRRYLTNSELAKLDVLQGQKIISSLFGQQAIGQLWHDVINSAINEPDNLNTLTQPELIAAIHLPQDIDLIRPVLEEAYKQGIQCVVWSSIAAIQRWPQLTDAIRNLGCKWRIFPDNLSDFDTTIFPDTAYALLSVTETNLNPHRFTHQLTKLANSAGLFTATMQHGYENVGLNYSDDVHDIQQIEFAASQIYIWGNQETLHANIPQQTLKKCFPIGCPKPASAKPICLQDLLPTGQSIIGIFENLHWHRYSDEYRNFFLEGLLNIAEAFPHIYFLVKPHNAGMWLTSRYQGEKLKMSNLIIIDPKDTQWVNITAPQLFEHLIAVITTPSTIALDAARAKIPCAVVTQKLSLENYEPLPLIHQLEDWNTFTSQVLESGGHETLKEKSCEFVNRVLLPENAAQRIIQHIKSLKQEYMTKKKL